MSYNYPQQAYYTTKVRKNPCIILLFSWIILLPIAVICFITQFLQTHEDIHAKNGIYRHGLFDNSFIPVFYGMMFSVFFGENTHLLFENSVKKLHIIKAAG